MVVDAPEKVAPAQQDGSRSAGSLRMLYRYTLRYKALLFGTLAFLLVYSLATLLIFSSIGHVLESGFSTGQPGAARAVFLPGLAVIFVLAAANFLHNLTMQILSEKVVADIRGDVHAHLLTLAPVHFETNKPAELASRLTSDTGHVHEALGAVIATGVNYLVVGVGALAIVLSSYPALVLVVFAIAAVVTVPLIAMGRLVRRLSRVCQEKVASIGSTANETFSAIQVVQAFTHEREENKRFMTAVRDVYDATKTRSIATSAWDTGMVLLLFSAVDIGLWMGAESVARGSLSIADLVNFAGLTFVLMNSVMYLSEVYSTLQRAAGSVERIAEILETPSTLPVAARPRALPRPFQGDVRFTNVSFAYPSKPDIWALRNFDLHLKAGHTTALVGPSGAGKSTVLQLLLRFFDAQEGSICAGPLALQSLDPHEWRSNLAVVSQDTFIFSDTIAANVRFGKPDATDEELRAALHAAHCDEFVRRLPQGIYTYLGEKGVRLSGGQRQRVSIARALLRNAPILLLDEATSSLDSGSEHLIQRALQTLVRNKTTLVIAHRLSTVREAHTIVVLDGGRVVDSGPHEELVRKGGLYAQLARMQFAQQAIAAQA